MLRLIFAFMVFIAPLALAGGYLEWRLAQMPNSYTKKRDIIAGPGADARIAVLGSSRELNGISPSEFDCDGVNLANVAESLFYSGEVMKRQLRTSRNLRLVIQGITPLSFDYQVTEGVESWRTYHYHRFLDTGFDHSTNPFDLRRVSMIALYGQRVVADFARQDFDVDLVAGIGDRGWQSLVGIPGNPSDDAECKQMAALHASLSNAKYRDENRGALEAMIEDLESRGVKVALAIAPVTNSYARHFPADTLVRMRAETAALVARHHLVLRDYSADRRFKVEDFFNCDHLSPRGAIKYSRILNTEIVRPLGACAERSAAAPPDAR